MHDGPADSGDSVVGEPVGAGDGDSGVAPYDDLAYYAGGSGD